MNVEYNIQAVLLTMTEGSLARNYGITFIFALFAYRNSDSVSNIYRMFYINIEPKIFLKTVVGFKRHCSMLKGMCV